VPDLEVLTGDAIALLPTLEQRFDIIFLDAFDNDKTPAGLITETMLPEIGLRLNADGWLAANVYAGNLSLRALHRRWREAFPQVLQVRQEPLFWPILFAAVRTEPLNFVDLGARTRAGGPHTLAIGLHCLWPGSSQPLICLCDRRGLHSHG